MTTGYDEGTDSVAPEFKSGGVRPIRSVGAGSESVLSRRMVGSVWSYGLHMDASGSESTLHGVLARPICLFRALNDACNTLRRHLRRLV